MSEPNIFLSKSYKRADTNLKGKLTTAYLKTYPHCTLPNYNLHNEAFVDEDDIETFLEQFREYPYYCDFPRPLLPPARLPRTVIDDEDPALSLLSIKKYIKNDMDRIKSYYQKHIKEFEALTKKKLKWRQGNKKATIVTIPRYLTDLAEIIMMDPDPYFDGAYNWYYTGGTLDYVKFKGSDILLFPYMGELAAVPIDSVEDFVWKPLLRNSTKCELDGSLFELKHNIFDNICILLGRFKYHCNIYILSFSNNKHKLHEIHKESSKIPFIGAALSPSNQNQYCTVNIERLVSLWDLTKVKCINKGTVLNTKVHPDGYGSLIYTLNGSNVLCYMDRCCLHYLDTRLQLDAPVLKLCPKPHLESCENLSILTQSHHNSACVYVGSSHSLLMCDNRFSKDCVEQKWAHHFQSAPSTICVTTRLDQEIILLSSQIAQEKIIILNTWSNDEVPRSFNYPFAPPSIIETLNESQLQGLALDPNFRTRLELSNIGLTTVRSNEQDIYAFSQNSIGDIYYQCITHEEAINKYSAVNSKSFCILNSWNNAITMQPRTIAPLTICHKINMHHIYKNFTNKKLQMQRANNEMLDGYFEPSWKQSVDMLSSYVDILVPELLAAWEICEEVSLPLSAPPHQKVLNWLETATTKDISHTQEEQLGLSDLVNTQELISVSQQEPDITCLDDSNVLQELFLPKVRTKPTRKKRK